MCGQNETRRSSATGSSVSVVLSSLALKHAPPEFLFLKKSNFHLLLRTRAQALPPVATRESASRSRVFFLLESLFFSKRTRDSPRARSRLGTRSSRTARQAAARSGRRPRARRRRGRGTDRAQLRPLRILVESRQMETRVWALGTIHGENLSSVVRIGAFPKHARRSSESRWLEGRHRDPTDSLFASARVSVLSRVPSLHAFSRAGVGALRAQAVRTRGRTAPHHHRRARAPLQAGAPSRVRGLRYVIEGESPASRVRVLKRAPPSQPPIIERTRLFLPPSSRNTQPAHSIEKRPRTRHGRAQTPAQTPARRAPLLSLRRALLRERLRARVERGNFEVFERVQKTQNS